MNHSIRLFYFPKGFRYTTPVFFLFAIYMIFIGYKIIALIIIFVSLFILTAQYITDIDTQKKEFIDSFSFYWIPIVTERKKFRDINRIVVTKGSYAQAVNTRAQSRSFQWSDYTATLIYDDDQTLDLVTRQEKKEVLQFASLYAVSLQVGIDDLTRPSSSPTSYR